ncbi:MAG: hypothetical protein ACK5MQ_10295 [Pikeienuella sp.]
MFKHLPTAIAALALAACAGGLDMVTRVDMSPNYAPQWVSVFAASGGEATILGTTRDNASADEIAAALRLPAHVGRRALSAAPPGEAQGGAHLVLVFTPSGGVTGRKACRGEVSGGVAGPESLKVVGVFCTSYGTPVSEGQIDLKGSPVPSDPDFGRRMSYLMNAIMPAVNPQADSGCFRGC